MSLEFLYSNFAYLFFITLNGLTISVLTLNCIALEIPQLWTTLNCVRVYPNAIIGSWNHLNCYKQFLTRNLNSTALGFGRFLGIYGISSISAK